ncbi:polymorphic toxin type 44 domain-containing protein [Neobacillus sp. LXY-1]|uniref:polymorphic toxin type 44 domain-containing protein n=1 Tax=Neobacillus sp. LXY-1 TaxID=3379133 RepID=UPI003EE11E3F
MIKNTSTSNADLSTIYSDMSDIPVEDSNIKEELSDEQKAMIENLISSQVKEFEKEQAAIEQEIEQERLSVNTSPIATDYLKSTKLTDSTVVKLYQTNLKQAQKIKSSYNKIKTSNGTVAANTYRLSIFYSLVKSNGPWDLKRKLGKNTKYIFKDSYKTGEYIGNHHYGYMGRAIGFSTTVLKSAAGMYQVYSNTSNWGFISSYFDDPSDQAAITDGYKDYDNGYRFGLIIA